MRNPLFLFPIGILFVVGIAFLSVQFEVMTMNEFMEKMKMLFLLLTPVALIIGVFALSHLRQKKNDKK